MATITPVAIGLGHVVSYVAAGSGGDVVHNPSGDVTLLVKNSATGSSTVTLTAVEKCNQGFDHDVVVTVGASSESAIHMPKRCNDPVAGTAIAYSAYATITVAATL